MALVSYERLGLRPESNPMGEMIQRTTASHLDGHAQRGEHLLFRTPGTTVVRTGGHTVRPTFC
jgi:hypothetical protein